MYLFLDDIRNPDFPDLPIWYKSQDWKVFRTSDQILTYLSSLDDLSEIVVSLDNDLGEDQPEGYTVCNYLEERWFTSNQRPKSIFVHSSNPARRSSMNITISRIYHD